MKQLLFIGILLALSTSSWASYFCTYSNTYINLGDSTQQVEKACGKPSKISSETQQPKERVQTQQWNYRFGQKKPQLILEIVNDTVTNVYQKTQSADNSSLCQKPIKTGDDRATVRAACGRPSFIRRYSRVQDKPKKTSTIWTYSQPYGATLTLEFVDEKLAKIN